MRRHGIKGGSMAMFLLTMLMVAGVVGCSGLVFLVGRFYPILALAAPPSIMTLPATEVSGTRATLNGEVTALGGPQFVAVSAGYNHSLGVRSDGTLWAWGYNAYGQLGLGDTNDRWIPTQVGSATDWKAVSAGYRHSLGVRSDGTLWAWGRNTHITEKTDANPEVTSHGQLGLGDTTDKWIPTQVGSATNWVAVSAGGGHSLGVRSDGTLWAWGRNYFGQLGLGDRGDGTDRLEPTRVGSDTNWAAASAGYEHSLGVQADGTLWAWGWNPHHELGLGTFPEAGVNTPTRVGSDTNWAAVSAIFYYSLGWRSDGTLWGWGMNGSAQLGLGDTKERYVPTQVGSTTNWIEAGGGIHISVGLRSDGTLWKWGGVYPYWSLSPTQVGSATNWAALEAGGSHFLGVRSDGTLWAWGGNGYGELGLGDTTNRGSPTQVILSPSSCRVSFEWGPTTSYGNETAQQTVAGGGTFSADISGLTLGAIYHFRAKVESEETVYGEDMTFMAVTAPSVTTNDAGSITTSSARLNGDLTSLGTASSVTVSFAWGTSSESYSQETAGQVITSNGPFFFDLASLDPGGTYYFKAKAVGVGGAVYGDEKRFTTGQSPVVQGVDTRRGKRGQHLTVTISGANFDGATDVSFGSGITVESFDVSGNVITAEIAIDRDAEVGPRDVSVTTSMGTDTITGGFAVTTGSSRLPLWVYPVAIVGGLLVLMIVVAVGARLVRRLVS